MQLPAILPGILGEGAEAALHVVNAALDMPRSLGDALGLPVHQRDDIGDIAQGDTMVVSVAYEGSDPFIYRDWWIDDRNTVPKFTSRSSFESSSETGYYRDATRLYLRLAQQDDKNWAHLTVCREQGC